MTYNPSSINEGSRPKKNAKIVRLTWMVDKMLHQPIEKEKWAEKYIDYTSNLDIAVLIISCPLWGFPPEFVFSAQTLWERICGRIVAEGGRPSPDHHLSCFSRIKNEN